MSALAIELIIDAYNKKATFLDLGDCDLHEIPKEILQLKDFLQGLNLGSWYLENTNYKNSANNANRNNISDAGNSWSILAQLPLLSSLHLHGCYIGDVDIKHISNISSLTFLGLNYNKIGIAGTKYLSRLSSLATLHLKSNEISEEGAKYISQLSSLVFLDLGFNNIGENGAKYISQLSSLTSLVLDANNIGEKGAEYISRLHSLTSLELYRNDIGEKGAEYISHLHSLTYLALDSNNIGEKGAEYISRLSSLSRLDISYNDIGDIGMEYVCRLSSLRHLRLSDNNISDVGMQYIGYLSSLKSLSLARNNIGNIGMKYLSRLSSLTLLLLDNNEIDANGLESISMLLSLTFLDLGGNNVGDKGSEYISRLSSLTSLSLNGSNIGDRGVEYICKLSSLASLSLMSNKISKLNPKTPISIGTLRLQNNLIETISSDLIQNVSLEVDMEDQKEESTGRIFLYGNPIKNAPSEVLRKGRDAILEYLASTLKPLNECKLIFVGDGSVGKTSLMKRLVYGKFEVNEVTTHGINKIAWKGLQNDKGETIKVNLWDFGGQHIQHSLHQFFFTERVVYVLVFNPRNDEKAGYWLDQVDKLGRNSQIIIVYNWKDKADKEADFLRNFRELRKTYKYLPEPIILSCATGEGMPGFEAAVKMAVLANEGLKTEYPKTWFNIKEKLETRIPIEKHYIKYPEYETWCAEEDYNDPDRKRNLLRILDSVGSIVFFDKPVLNELQVLNPEWISTGAYAIITSEITRKEKGHLTWDNLRAIFNKEKEIFSDKNIRIKYEEPQFKFILQLMLDYKLCQKNPLVEHEYLIPGAFGEKPAKEYDVAGGRHYRLKFQSSFEMLIIHRFIAKNILNIVSNDYWNSGIYFKHASSMTYTLVDTNQYSQVIDCWIKGDNIRGMWEVIRNDFREIFNMYHNFPVDEEVEYASGGRTVFLKYDEMIGALNNGVSVIPYDTKTGLKDIDVHLVLELFESPDQTKRSIGREQINVEVNPQIIVNPQFTNNPTINTNYSHPEHSKEQPKTSTHDLSAENSLVKKWKNKALKTFAFSSIITIFLILAWIKKWILDAATWQQLEQQEAIKWSGIVLGLVWNSFIGKILYDRFLDPSKEKAFRESLRK